MKKIKKYFWYIVGAVAIIVVAIFLKDLGRLEEIKSFFRRKEYEDEVNKIKEKMAATDVEIAANDAELAELAEKLEKDKIKVDNATDDEVIDFYKDFFNN